jgi:UDP-N-acetylglucosamine enolpyruvyl transferase
MVPVGVPQVGCTVTLAVGTAGTAGTAFTVNAAVEAEIQVLSALLREVSVWVPGAKPLKVTLAW